MKISDFQKNIWDYYQRNSREMPWRQNTDPYWVFLSEIMLQQTQVNRVIPKFIAFMDRFPNMLSLSLASTQDLLLAWQGLGYNNRALRLREAAKQIIQKYGSEFPKTPEEWDRLPGIGPATAAAICVYTFNQPNVFIETNIRRVFLHHFFEDSIQVDDKELLPVVNLSLDHKNPREWYWALMDYGSYLKTQIPNPNRRSKQHTIQSKFTGSTRQVRGEIIRRLLVKTVTQTLIEQEFPEKGGKAIQGLLKDQIINRKNDILSLI